LNVNSIIISSSNIFAGTNDGIYLSTNNGLNWNQTGLDNYTINSLRLSGSYIFAGTTNWGFYLSTNNGLNWTSTLSNRTIFTITNIGANVFAGSTVTYGVYYSSNNGLNWSTNTPVNNKSVLSLAVNGSNIFAGTGLGGVYLSTNNGQNWTQVGLNNKSVFSLITSGTNLFAGVSTTGAGNDYEYGIYLSTNNGQNWIEKNQGFNGYPRVKALQIVNDYVLAGTEGCSVWRRPLSELVGIADSKTKYKPSTFSLSQNYPNPFNPVTYINIDINKLSYVKLTIYDVLGRELEVLINEILKPGSYKVDWDGSSYASGVYFYRMQTNEYTAVKKMLLVK
jgi:hypothetical protein